MMTISGRGLLLVIIGISILSTETLEQQSPAKEARSIPEYVLKYAYDHVESPAGGNKYVEAHSPADDETKRITQTNTVFFKHKIIPVHHTVYSYFDYPLQKDPHHSVVVPEKKFPPEHPIIRPEVKIVPFSDERKIESHDGKDVKLVHFHFPDEKEITHYPSPVHYFADSSYPHLEKGIPFKLDREIVQPFPIEKTLPYEIIYPIRQENRLTIPLVEANSNYMTEETKQETPNATAVRKESDPASDVAVEKTIPNPTHLQQKPPIIQETPSEKKEVPGTYPVQVNIPVQQLGKDVRVAPFVIKFELSKEDDVTKEGAEQKERKL